MIKKIKNSIINLLIIAPILFVIGQLLVFLRDDNFTLLLFLENVIRNFSIEEPQFLIFWLHVPATIYSVIRKLDYSKYLKFYWLIIIIVTFMYQFDFFSNSKSALSGKYIYVSEKQAKKTSSLFLRCKGLKEVYRNSIHSFIDSDSIGDEMSEPNIEVSVDDNSIYYRTVYFDREVKFLKVSREPQIRKNEIDGRTPYYPCKICFNDTIKINFLDNKIYVELSKMINDMNKDDEGNYGNVSVRKSTYLCHER